MNNEVQKEINQGIDVQTEERYKVTKRDLRKTAARYNFMACNIFNYESQMGPAIAWAMAPVLRKIYKKDDEYTLVTINSSKQTIQTSLRLDGANINGLLKQYITNEDNSWTEMAIVQENKEYYNLTIPPYSVVTFVGKVRL